MEKGFYHPAVGYWQTISDPSAELRLAYPEGTIEVPLKPGANFDWNGEVWIKVPELPEEAQA